MSRVSAKNSTSTPLGNAGVFTGEWEELSDFETISCVCASDQTCTVDYEFSTNATNVDKTISVTCTSTVEQMFPVTYKYYRVVVTNGATPMTYLRLQSILSDASRIAIPTSLVSDTVDANSSVLNIKLASVDSGLPPINVLSGGISSGINAVNVEVLNGVTYLSASEQNSYNDVAVVMTSTQNGILKFEFSNDDATWSTFPVNGFNVSAGINEFHTAVKLPRYFRWNFENNSGMTATINTYIYYGAFRQGNLPLNQSITDDADSTIVRAIQTGSNPLGVYENVKKDGSAFSSTTNLAGTALSVGFAAGFVGNITVGSTTDFPSSGYILVESEFIEYDSIVSPTIINIITRGAFGSSDAPHLAVGTAVGGVYYSGILTLSGYTQVATKILCDKNGLMRFRWFSDSAGTDNIRTIVPSYTASFGYSYLSAPNFGSYVAYVFGNTETSTTTDFYFETEFYTKAISGQLLTVNDTVLGSMTANLGKNIIVGATEGGNYLNAGITDANELLTNTRASNRQTRALYNSGNILSDTYAILVDLSAEPYTNYVSVDNVAVTCSFAVNNSTTNIKLGVITRINGVDSDISWLVSIPFSAANANTFLSYINNFQPSAVQFRVSGGSLVNAYTNDTSSLVSAVNTGITLTSPRGNVTPAVGDIIMFFDHVGNNFSSTVSAVYHTD